MDKCAKFEIDTRVYRETTLPLDKRVAALRDDNVKTKRPRRDKSDLGENFIAPDGGWAWLVCIAAGVSNLTLYPCLQQFGFIFRERMTVLGMTSSQITTLINTNPSISACTGLLNGPMFRRFTFRQVALTGALLVFTGLMLTAFCESFISYLISYAILFGFGMGISVSASSLAINTYFKNKRRRAAGFSWTITGLGPIFLPYFVTYLVAAYGVQGTVIIFAGISLHSMICGLIYQPVRYHAPRPEPIVLPDGGVDRDYMCQYCEMQTKKTGIFSSQYLYQDDDEDTPGYEIIEPGTPMLSRANDGWFGSKPSLIGSGSRARLRSVSNSKDIDAATTTTTTTTTTPMRGLNRVISEEEELRSDEFMRPNNFKRERDETLRHSNSKSNLRQRHPNCCTCAEERALLEITQLQHTMVNGKPLKVDNNNEPQSGTTADDDFAAASSTASVTFLQKVVAFFDLDLLRDFTYVNLVLGLTMINFGELNFSILTPFILNDFGFDTSQITLAMSVLAGLDITVRFLVPFFTEKIPWDNRVFFLIGVVGIAIGRTVVACTRSYTVILCCFVWIGMCKGIRTIFWPLIIPGYVPLKRLPAASGLQLLISGLFSLAGGPFVGLIRDRYDYSVCLHCLNMMTFISALSWTLEALLRRYFRRRKRVAVELN